jgi:hypothetical protein
MPADYKLRVSENELYTYMRRYFYRLLIKVVAHAKGDLRSKSPGIMVSTSLTRNMADGCGATFRNNSMSE